MAIFYYLDISRKHKNIARHETNLRVARAVQLQASSGLSNFRRYLHTAIEVAKRKEAVKAAWELIEEEPNVVYLKPLSQLCLLPKKTSIRLRNNEPGLYHVSFPGGEDERDFEKPLCYKDKHNPQNKGELKLKPTDFIGTNLLRLDLDIAEFSMAVWGYNTLALSPTWLPSNSAIKVTCMGQDCTMQPLGDGVFELPLALDAGAAVSYQGRALDYELISGTTRPKEARMLKDLPEHFLVSLPNSSSVKGLKKIAPENWGQHIELDKLFLKKDATVLPATRLEGLTYQLEKPELYQNASVYTNDGLEFKLEVQVAREPNWIQLKELDEGQEEESQGHALSPLRYFFDDEVEIWDEKGKIQYQVLAGREAELALLLGLKTNSRPQAVQPSTRLLSLKINTYNLRKQQEAVSILQDMPSEEQALLLQLFEDRSRFEWERTRLFYNEINSWFVLTDAQRSGADSQRDFVQKALKTPDFAILEGPPGSGKTTVILEFICQAIQKNKRILLCGSTHVAIDNVLERLKDKKLLESLNILPVRIGDERRVSEEVRMFQLSNLVASLQVEEKLLLETSNLVCGTTIGILQHPAFRRSNKDFAEPIIPEFDYLIIDESSKTTFQEFLVPALYAKRWILVGDVMQLSPFTDRDQLVANIENLPLKEENSLPKAYQVACLYLYQIQELFKRQGTRLKLLCPLSEEQLKAVFAELQERDNYAPKLGQESCIIGFYDNPKKNSLRNNRQNWILLTSETVLLSACDILFVTHEDFKRLADSLPTNFLALDFDEKASTNLWHFRRAAARHPEMRLAGRNKHADDLLEEEKIFNELRNLFQEKTWADEIAWRVDREHQLRLNQKQYKNRHYRQAIEDLLPRSLGDMRDLANRIDTIAQIALPSILEMLQRGLPKRDDRHKDTTLHTGFCDLEKQTRHTILEYQQRMHPAISAFPRTRFYENKALLDREYPRNMTQDRAWDYNHYPQRSYWLNVRGKVIRGGNRAEVKALMDELKKFADWARHQPPPQGENTWTVACLSFYRKQERLIQEELRQLCNMPRAISNFQLKGTLGDIKIKLHTVDKFQGQEADLVLLSMVQTFRDGFMDSPNRLNVAITRARYQLVILGDYEYFSKKSRSDELRALAQAHENARKD